MINILIVEDDEEIIQFCNDAWHRLDDGIKVFVAQSAEEALLILKQNRIDGTFIDIGLPGDNGFSLAMKIQSMENYHFLPIVFETGENKDLPETYKKYHNFGYLSKPFTEKDLLDSTATLIREIETQKNILHKNIDREIPIFDSEGQSIISFSNLLYATKYERKLKVATKNGVHFISGLHFFVSFFDVMFKYVNMFVYADSSCAAVASF